MCKRILLLFLLLVLSVSLFAQLEVKEGSFKKVEGFVNINTDKMYDDNDKPYAVLKIRTENINNKQRRELKFQGDAQTFFEIEYRDGEVWLYISYYATFLKISHPDLSSTDFYFPFDMQPKMGYELTLMNKSVNDELIKMRARLEELENANAAIVPIVNMEPTHAVITSGKFSVSVNKKVNFSQGNLQYQASTNTWRFAENQYDVIGIWNKKISSNYNEWIDLFGWGTGEEPTKITSDIYAYSVFSDWGKNEISNGHDKSWCTLTQSEWDYLINTRNTKPGVRYAKAKVNSVNGMILLPDDWDSNLYIINQYNNKSAHFDSNFISLDDWNGFLESNGAVFLPAAGCRNETSVESIGDKGYYWSSTPNTASNSSYYLLISDRRMDASEHNYNSRGRSVRLVCNAE